LMILEVQVTRPLSVLDDEQVETVVVTSETTVEVTVSVKVLRPILVIVLSLTMVVGLTTVVGTTTVVGETIVVGTVTGTVKELVSYTVVVL